MQHSAMKDNKDLACYFVTKHSWKGKYKRIFSVGNLGITTYNPQTLEITNQWPYSEFINIEPNVKSYNEFVIRMKRGERKRDAMRFSSDHRPDILTQALKFRAGFAERPPPKVRFNAVKLHWSERRTPVVLEANLASLDQVHPTNGRVLCSYDYKDMETLRTLDDLRGGLVVVHGGYGRLHGFLLDEKDLVAFTKALVGAAYNNVGLVLKEPKERMSHDAFVYGRLGKYSDDEHITSTSEFLVQKHSPARHGADPMRRLLCLSETCLVERDPATYHVVTCKPLCDVFALVRDAANPQLLVVEFVKGFVCCYLSTDRDALIASVLDGVRASGNRDICVKMRPTDRGLRFGPFTVPVDEEVESQHMKFLHQPPPGMSFSEAVARFNANISYSGLLHAVTQDGLFAENKEKLINGALASLITREGDQSEISSPDLEAQFHALRRLVASKAGFQSFTELPRMRETLGRKVVTALKRFDDGVAHAALDTINALMTPMHDKYDIRQEQLNKQSIMSSRSFLDSLLTLFEGHVTKGSGALIISAMLDLLTFALCAPYSETTDGAHFDTLLEMVAERGRVMYKLFQHPSPAIVKGAGLVSKAIIEEGEPEVASRMQELALAEGALPKHLLVALFTQTTDARMLTNRQLSRHLVSLWVTGSPIASALMKRIIPAGLMGYLDKPGVPPREDIDRLNVRDNLKLALDHEERTRGGRLKNLERRLDQVLVHWRARIGLAEKKRAGNRDERPVVLRKRRQRVRPDANWAMFYYQFSRDHTRPDLIWNYKTREELKNGLEEQIRSFTQDCGGDVGSGSGKLIAWNHAEFEVAYPSLATEIRIGEYYLRLLLEEDALFEQRAQDAPASDGSADGERAAEEGEGPVALHDSYQFFNDLYHRFLLTSDVNMRCLCLQAMAVVYGRCHERVGPFNDTRYIVNMLAKCCDRQERDRILLFIQKLILNRRNVKELIEAGGIRVLMDLATLAHLHVSRAHTPQQSNVIEAAPDARYESEKEWHFSMPDKSSSGPHSFEEMRRFFEEKTVSAKTRCWAQGLEGWRPLENISQLKWTLVAGGTAVLNESDLCVLILNILIRVCDYFPSKDEFGAVIRPVPKAKALLSNVSTLPHLVQLLLTFDPIIVEKVAVLLNHVVDENPYVSRLYLTGVFFFICMYTGSNVLPIAYFLKYTHLQQAFRSEETTGSDLSARSILGHLLPEAMVCYLENYAADRFAAIFLGEFDTPEAIWSAEMRRLMIEKIAGHLADFTPRLRTNNRALYQYCPIPVVSYPQLENELFCNIYYLRHLCDTRRFPDWEIKSPVGLLKDILLAWKREVEKQPPTMSIDDAFASLGLQKGVEHEEAVIRKAYHRLAQRYHPDKNRDKEDTRDKFEEVNKAYEYLCSRSRLSDGPDPKNIVLILKTQSILFSRYREVLAPYKYSGYPMLIKTIRMETADEQLFSKSSPILAAAAELAFHTVNASALNAEEMRRENGIEVLQEAFARCVSVLGASSKQGDLAVHVCAHIAKFYAVAAQFEACRERIQEMPHIVKDLLRVLYYKHLPHLTCIVADTVSAFCIDFWLQTCMHQNGVLFHLLPPLFAYDFTLDEGGVERSEESNQQEAANKLARFCVRACARLAGYPHPSDPHVQAHRAASPASTPSPASEASPPNGPAPEAAPGPEAHARTLSAGAGAATGDGITVEMLRPASLSGDLRQLPLPPDNPAVKTSLRALLTPFLSRKLEELSSEEILKYFTCNWETPYLLWDNTTRAELLEFLERQQTEVVRSGECDPNMGADFVFSLHKDELVIGDIFVRIYNEHPEFVLENPKSFAIDLLHYLNDQAQYLHSLLALQKNRLALKPEQKMRLSRVEAALEGLRNVIRNNPGIEMQCIGHFKLLFALLRLTGCKRTQGLAVEVINCVTKNEECIKDIAASEVLVYLIMCCESLPECHKLILETLSPLMGTTKLTKEAVYRGALVYLLDLFCNSADEETRVLTADVLSRMMADKLVGPRIRIILGKFLPPLFLDAMRDGPSEAVVLFERGAENPELIWNDNTRGKLCQIVEQMKKEFYGQQLENPDAKWNLPESFEVAYAELAGEAVVAGVFLRLFIANPAWVLRRPRDFLVELFERWASAASAAAGFHRPSDAERLELLGQALCALLRAQSNLLAAVPQLGYVPAVVGALAGDDAVGPALDLCFELSRSTSAIATLAAVSTCVENLGRALRQRPDKAPAACECLHNLFEAGNDELVAQALACKLIPQLLGLLETGLEQHENAGSAKAHIVDALKAMQNSAQHGDQVRAILGESRIWRDYKDQRHDLFITNTNVAGYLTAGTPQMAGYLMSAGASSNRSGASLPPPQEPFRQ